jgi:hypothetical protein
LPRLTLKGSAHHLLVAQHEESNFVGPEGERQRQQRKKDGKRKAPA